MTGDEGHDVLSTMAIEKIGTLQVLRISVIDDDERDEAETKP